MLPVSGPFGALLPGGGVVRGVVVAVEGTPGSGATSVTCELVAAATAGGEWAAVVDPYGSMGGGALLEAGVVGERCAVVRVRERARWGAVVAALLDGVALVAADVPVGVRAGEARRLTARARERGAVLVVSGAWPGEAALRLRAEGIEWAGMGAGGGVLTRASIRVTVDGRGAASRARTVALAG